jgi:hypothetical protein
MAYTINLTDGAILTTIPDGTVNTTSTSLVLVGKNYAGYGEFLDENFVKLLENGANNVPPSTPLVGQLWWDKSTNTMRVYNGTAFKVISGATASSSAPTSNVPGDLWWDTANGQLKVWNGTNFTLIGPASSGPGVSGAIVTTVTDIGGNPRVVVQLFVDDTIVAIVSKAAFTPAPQAGLTGFSTISPGIQLNDTLLGSVFRGTATNAQLLDNISATSFMRSNINTSTTGTLAVLNDSGFNVGVDQDARISVTTATSEVRIDNITNSANLSFSVNTGSQTTVMRALGNTGEVTFPAAAGVNVTGNITVPQIVKSGANNSGNIGSATNVFNTVFANTFQGTVSTATNVSGTVAVVNGGTGRNTLNTGAVLLGNGTGNVNFVVPGADGNVLTASGGTWVSQAGGGGGGGNVTSVTAAVGSPISVGGTSTAPVVGINSIASNAVLLGNGTGQFQTVAPGDNGNVLTASGGIWVSQAGGGGGGSSIVNGTSNVTVVSSGGIIRANVGGSTIQTINSTGVDVTGRVTATGNVYVDSGATRGLVYDQANNQVAVGITNGTGIFFKSTSPTGNIDIIAGNVVTTGRVFADGYLSSGRTFNFDATSSIYKQPSGDEVAVASSNINLVRFTKNADLFTAYLANQDLGMSYDQASGAFGVGKSGGPGWIMTGFGVGGNIEAVAGNVIIGGAGNFVGNSIGQFNNFSGSTAIYGGNPSGGEFRELNFDVNGSRRMQITFVNSATAVNSMYANTVPSTNNAFTLGEGTTPRRWSEVFATNGTINTSDQRLKTDVIDSPLGLSFIDKLRPVAYRWIVGQNVEDGYDEQAILDENGDVRQLIRIPRFRPVPGVRMHYGLISQEVKAALDQEAVEDFAGWVLGDKNDPDSEQSLRMTEFIAPMIQAIKELKSELDNTKAELDQTKARLAELESQSDDPES